MSTIRNIIDNAAKVRIAEEIADEQKSSVWGDLKNTVPPAPSFVDRELHCDTWLLSLEPDENQFMEDNFGSEPLAKKKDGSWKYRAFKDSSGKQVFTLPPEYVSAKSVIKSCILNGIDVHLDMGKTEAQKKIREKKAASDPASAFDKVMKYIKSAGSNWDALSHEEKIKVQEEIELVLPL